MKIYTNLKFNSENHELVNIAEFTDINKAINKLILLSKAGNQLAKKLYDNIKNKLNDLTNEISIQISYLNSLILYRDLSEIFDSTLYLNSLKIVPISILEESNNLTKGLEDISNWIKIGNMNNYTKIINNNIYDYLKESHKLIFKISNNLKEMINIINSKRNYLNEISKYYLNQKSFSYNNLFQKAYNILLTYYKNEKDLIIPEIQSIILEFEDIFNYSIKKEKKLIDLICQKLENKSFIIENINNEDYNKITII